MSVHGLMLCGHHRECVWSSGEGTPHCSWCAEVADLRVERDALQARIDAALAVCNSHDRLVVQGTLAPLVGLGMACAVNEVRKALAVRDSHDSVP